MSRPAHSKVHARCPNSARDWATCDKLEARRFGQCKAVVGDKHPKPCTRWAVDAGGWCWQHYTAEIEKAKQAEAKAAQQLQLQQRIDAHIAWVAEHPSLWDPDARKLATQEESTRGLKGVAPAAGVEPAAVRFGDGGAAVARRRGPFRVG